MTKPLKKLFADLEFNNPDEHESADEALRNIRRKSESHVNNLKKVKRNESKNTF